MGDVIEPSQPQPPSQSPQSPQPSPPATYAERLVARMADALVPCGSAQASRLESSRTFLNAFPRPIRLAFVGLVVLVWHSAWGVRLFGWPWFSSHTDAFAALVYRMHRTPIALLHRLGLWLKMTACLIALGHEEDRKALYQPHGIKLPSVVPTPRPRAASVTTAAKKRLAEAARRAAGTAVPAVATAAATATTAMAEDAKRQAPGYLHQPPVQGVADYIVVGSGPAGATVARTLAQAGHSVLILEEGPLIPDKWAAPTAADILASRMRAAGGQLTSGPDRIPILQASCVGGSSVVNSAIVWEAPGTVWDDWYQDPSIAAALPHNRIDQAYAAIDAAQQSEPTGPKIAGDNNLLLARGADALGLSHAPTRRYTASCQGLGRCLEGCPKGHKLAVNLTLLPDAVRAGAVLIPNCRVRRLLFDGNRAVGVRAVLKSQDGGHAPERVTYTARCAVIVAASAIQTPILLRRSGVRHPLVGARFQAHPGASMTGVFPDPVRATYGATQGHEVDHYKATEGFKIESLHLPDDVLALRMPGTGKRLMQSAESLPFTAAWAAVLKAQAHGRVGGWHGLPHIRYRLTGSDARLLGQAMYRLGELLFAAGATKVWPSVLGFREEVTELSQLEPLCQGVQGWQTAMIASHLFGTAVMGGDAAWSVCDAHGRVHGVQGLVVADSSLFPTNLGVNPQHTIMAIAQHVAWRLLEDRRAAVV